MHKICIIFFLSVLTTTVLAQHHYDNTWVLGYKKKHTFSNGMKSGGMIMRFDSFPPKVDYLGFKSDTPLACFSDESGRLLAYTEGCKIWNRDHEVMPNSDTLSPGTVFKSFCPNFYPLWQGCLFLPYPGNDSLFMLFHVRKGDKSWDPENLYCTVLNQNLNEGKGGIVQKRLSVIEDDSLGHYVTATRHANGRDWWIVMPQRFLTGYHVVLVSPEGFTPMPMQHFGTRTSYYWGGQAAFSADGSKYVRTLEDGMQIMDFDRCTGRLSNFVYIQATPEYYMRGGVCTSADSRYLYLSSGDKINQFDLKAPDIAASRQVVVTDNGMKEPFDGYFFQTQMGADARIYAITNGNNHILHVIKHPERGGVACKAVQGGLRIPAIIVAPMLNFVHYRLGPLDGSSCDTLGLDNRPQAEFRTELDTVDHLGVEFTDVSYYLPTAWRWDFGDPASGAANSSSLQHPEHRYSASGAYKVCLIASNQYAADTICKTVRVGTLSAGAPALEAYAQVWPNPAHDLLYVSFASPLIGLEGVLHFSLVNALGQVVKSLTLNDLETEVSLQGIPPGLYVWQIRSGRSVVQAGKVVVK